MSLPRSTLKSTKPRVPLWGTHTTITVRDETSICIKDSLPILNKELKPRAKTAKHRKRNAQGDNNDDDTTNAPILPPPFDYIFHSRMERNQHVAERIERTCNRSHFVSSMFTYVESLITEQRCLRVLFVAPACSFRKEQDIIRKEYLPELQSMVEALGLSFSFFDLGIDYSADNDEYEDIFELYLKEVKRSHIILGFYGENYGSFDNGTDLPSASWARRNFARASVVLPWVAEHAKKLKNCSAHDLSWRLALNVNQRCFTFFFFRDKSYDDRVFADFKASGNTLLARGFVSYNDMAIQNLQDLREYTERRSSEIDELMNKEFNVVQQRMGNYGNCRIEQNSSTNIVHQKNCDDDDITKEKSIIFSITDYSMPREAAFSVYHSLLNVVKRLPAISESVNVLNRERDYHIAFATSRRKLFVAAPLTLKKIDCYVDLTKTPLVIAGEKGVGKSALLANWIAVRTLSQSQDQIFYHFTGCTRFSTSLLTLLRRLYWELDSDDCRNSDGTLMPLNAIISMFPDLLERVSKSAAVRSPSSKIIIILDGLNELKNTELPWLSETEYLVHELGWLPKQFPHNVRLLLSATTLSKPVTRLQERNYNFYVIRCLGDVRQENLLRQVLDSWLDSLNLPSLITPLLKTNAGTRNPFFLRLIALEAINITYKANSKEAVMLSLGQGSHDQVISKSISSQEDEVFTNFNTTSLRSFSPFSMNIEKKTQARIPKDDWIQSRFQRRLLYLSTAESLPDLVTKILVGLEPLFSNNSKSLDPRGYLCAFLKVLAVSDRGLAEYEMRDLLFPSLNRLSPDIPHTQNWFRLQNTLLRALVIKGPGEMLMFAHSCIRDIVCKRYLSDASSLRHAHRLLAIYFQSLWLKKKHISSFAERALEEIPAHHIKAKYWSGLGDLIGDADFMRVWRPNNSLDLAFLMPGNTVVHGVMVGLTSNSTLRLLSLENMELSNATTALLLDALQNNSTLLNLNLRHNKVNVIISDDAIIDSDDDSDDGEGESELGNINRDSAALCTAIIKFLGTNEVLRELDLRGNDIMFIGDNVMFNTSKVRSDFDVAVLYNIVMSSKTKDDSIYSTGTAFTASIPTVPTEAEMLS